MYCRNCGTYINGDADMCDACRGEGIAQASRSAPRLDMSAEGRGGAICSAVLGVVSMIPMLLSVIFAGTEMPGAAVIFALGCLACVIISIIKGIAGIKAFRRACREKASKPIASLACGIAGIAHSGVTMYLFIYCLGIVLMIADETRYFN